MNAIQLLHAVSGVLPPQTQSKTGSAQPTLLPAPTDAPADDMSALFAILAKNRQTGLLQAAKDLRYGQAAKRAAVARAKAALARARRARKKKSFWGKVAKTCAKLAKVAIVAAAVGAAIGTGGAAAPIVVLAWAGAGMSAAAFIQGETHVLEKCGVDADAAGKVETGLWIGGAVCTGGAVAAQALSAQAAGTAAQSASAEAAKSIGTKMQLGAVALGAAAGAGAGAATWQSGLAEESEMLANADAKAERAAEERLERMITLMLQDIEDADKSAQRTLEALQGTIQARGEALVLASKKV